MTDIAPVVAAFVEARLNLQTLDGLPDIGRAIDWDMAYDIQDAVVQGLGGDYSGWKLALSTEAGYGPRGFPGPTVGCLTEGTVIEDGARLASGDFNAPAVEPEIALVLSADLHVGDSVVTAADIRAITAAGHIVIELADTRFADKAAMTDFENIADNNSGALLIMGPEIADIDAAMAADVTMCLADGVVIDGAPAAARPDPFETVAYLANFLAKRGVDLRKGDVVTTGTCAVPTPAQIGKNTITFAGIGSVSFSLT